MTLAASARGDDLADSRVVLRGPISLDSILWSAIVNVNLDGNESDKLQFVVFLRLIRLRETHCLFASVFFSVQHLR